METNEITRQIIAAAMRIHSILGPGLLESAYRTCMCHEMGLRGLRYQSEVPVPLNYLGLDIEVGTGWTCWLRMRWSWKLKAVSKTTPVHEAQFLTYLKLSNRSVGLMINFHVLHLRQGIKRMVNNFGR